MSKRTKSVLVSVNGRAILIEAEVGVDGQVRLTSGQIQQILKALEIPDGSCIALGS